MKRKDTTSVVPPSPAKKARGNSPSNSQQSSTFAAHVRRPKTVKFSLTPKTAASTSKNASPKEKPSVQGKKGKTMTSAKKRKATSPKTGAKKTITVSGKKGKTVTSAKKGKSISGKDPTAATTSKKASSKKIATTIAKKTTRKKVKIVVSPLKTVTSPKKRKSTSPKTGAKKTITVSGKKGKTVTSAKKGKSTSPKTLKKKPTVPGKERKTVTSTKTKGKSTTSKISGKDPTAATTSKKASSKKPATTIAKKTTRKNVKIVVSPLKTVTSPEKSKSTSPKITVRSASTAAKETAAAIQSTDDITSAVTPSPAKRARENSPSNSPPLNISTDSGTGATDSKDKHDVIENPFVSYFNHKPDAKYATKHKSMKGLSKHKDTHLLRKNMRTQSSFKNKFALEKFAYILSKSHEALEFLDYLDTAIASESFDKNKAENNYPTPPAPIIEEFGQYCDLVVAHPEGKQIMNELKKLMSIIHNNQHLLDLCYDLCKNDLPSQPEMGTPEYMSYAFDLPSRLGDDDNVLEENGYELVFVNYHDDILTKSQQINTGVIQEEQAKLITYLNQLDIHFLKFCKVFRTATEEEIGTITLDYFLQFIHLENAADITIGPFSNIVEELIKIGKHLNECDQNKRNEIVPLLMAKRNKIPYIDTKTNDQKFIEQLTLASRVQIMLHHMYPIECTPFLHDECCEYQKIPCDKLRYYYDGLWILKTGSGTYNLLGAIHRLSVGDIMDLYDILHDSMLKGKHIKKFADNLLPSAAFHDDTSKTEFVKLHNHLVDILKKFGREQAIEDLEDLILALKFHHAVADNNDESSTLFKISRKIGHTENLGIFSDTPNEDVTNEQGPPVDELNRKQTPAYPSKSDSPSVIRVKIEHAQRSSPYYQQGNDQMMVDDEKADTVEKPAPESSSRQTHSTVSSATENQQDNEKVMVENDESQTPISQTAPAESSATENQQDNEKVMVENDESQTHISQTPPAVSSATENQQGNDPMMVDDDESQTSISQTPPAVSSATDNQQGNDQMMVDDEEADTVEKPAPGPSSGQTHSTVSSATENQQGDDKILSDNKATEASSSQLHLAAASGFEIAPLHSTPVTKSKVAMYQKLDSDITPIRSPQKNTNQSSGEATKSVTQDTHVRVVAEEELMHNCTVEEQCEAARRFFQNLYEEDAQFVKFISFALQGKKDLMSFESVQEFMKLQNHHPTEIRFKYLLNYAKTGYLSTKMQPSTLTSTLEYPTNVYDSLSHHITRVYDAFQENFDKWIDSSVHMKVMDPGKSDNGTGSQKQRSFQNIFEEYVARNISNSSFEKGIFEECARNMSSQQEGNIVYINKWGCWETYKV
jgi:hypothetical protein